MFILNPNTAQTPRTGIMKINQSKLTEAGKKIDKNAQQQDNSRGLLPDKQTAYLFLEQAITVLKQNRGRVCMIQPAGFLYNRNINTFRKNIFQKYQPTYNLNFLIYL